MEIECYAQRLLNPFRGVMHTIRYRSAEAVTTDGVEWDIYVANDALLDGLGRAAKRAQISDIRYGHWSAEKGLKRGPLFPSDDFKRLEEMGAVVYEHLLAMHRNVPFALLDPFELWLLDRAGRPLALLHSVRCDSETDTRPPLDWRAGLAAQDGFRSSAIEGLGESPAAYLTRYVNGLSAGVAQWFSRADDGAGLGLHTLNGGNALRGRVLESEAFPPLFIATALMDAPHQRLVRDYLAWQAAWLLLLPRLDLATRQMLETYACRQPELVEKHCRLYPAVIDQAAMHTARVKAALERSEPAKPAAGDVLPLEYTELGVTDGE